MISYQMSACDGNMQLNALNPKQSDLLGIDESCVESDEEGCASSIAEVHAIQVHLVVGRALESRSDGMSAASSGGLWRRENQKLQQIQRRR
jgi:hypothetical protein